MNIKQATVCLSVLAGSAIAFSATSAQAFTFKNDNPAEVGGTCGTALLPANKNIPSCTTGDGFQLIANPVGKDLQTQRIKDVTGVGVSKLPTAEDDVFAEIDRGEFLHLIAPKSGTVLKELGLSFLYVKGAFGDVVDPGETALVDVFGAGDPNPKQGKLQVLNNDTAKWTFGSIEQTITGNFTGSGPGYANILNPFGDLGIDKLILSVDPDQPDTSLYNDFALVNASTHEIPRVPEPATIAGLGVVAASLAVSRRRRQNNK